MRARLHLPLLSVGAAIVGLAFAGPASAATNPISGSVANGGCDVAGGVSVASPSRIEVSLASTAQNNTDVLAQIVTPDGQVVSGGSYTSYDTPGGGSYTVRVCSTYQAMSPPQLQYSGLIGTGPAGERVLVSQADVGGVLGAQTRLAPLVQGKAAIRTHAGLAWFTVGTAGNSTVTLRVVDPVHRVTRVVKGLRAAYSGRTLRITGHGLKLVLVRNAVGHVTFTSSRFKASGKVVRGGFQVIA